MTASIKSRLATLVLTTAIVACGDARATDAAQDDLKRDLELATATTMTLARPPVDSALLTSLETQPQSAPEEVKTVKRGAGPRVVQSEAPTVEAEIDVDVAAVDETMEVETESIAPAPEINEPVAIAPRPQPVIIQTGGAGDYGAGRGGMGGGGGGVVIRGGGVDGDHCQRHGGRGGIFVRRPVYAPIAPTLPTTGMRGTRSGGGSSVSRTPPSSARGGSTPQVASRPSARSRGR